MNLTESTLSGYYSMDSERSSRHRNPSKSVHVCSSCELENRHLNCDSVYTACCLEGRGEGEFRRGPKAQVKRRRTKLQFG